MNKIAFTSLILCLSASTAFAQSPQYKGGMKYTTLSAGQQQDAPKNTIYNRKPTAEEPQAEESETAEKSPEKTPEQSAWDKYKALASGKGTPSGTKEGSALPKAPEKPATPERASEKEETKKSGGFASIIENYQQNKAKRSQIRSISYEVPEDLQINKPEVETPNIEKPSVKKPEVKKDN